MRVLVVDQDSALLTAITQLLGEYFSIDAVTTKSDCLDLVRVNQFDVIVAGERLEDGSGLELLGQMGRNRPDMLRIFAVDRERLKLLKGRLGPFRLFRTLSYPIEPRQLLAALSAAAGIEEELDGIEDLAVPETPAARPVPASPPSRPEPVEVTVRAVRQPQPAPAPQMRREVHDFALVDEEPSAPAPPPPPRRASKSRNAVRAAGRQPTPEALALGSRLAAARQAKAFAPPLLQPNARRSAFLVGAGVVVVIGAMAVALHIFNTPDKPAFSTASLTAPPSHDPPEVVKLIADTEAAFQQDDYKAARTDIAALQQIAPTHPRLPFFESLLAKSAAGASEPQEPASSGPARWFARHFSTPRVTHTPASVRTPQKLASNSSRAPLNPTVPPAPATFSGKTVEDSNASNTHEPEVIKRVPAEYPDDAARKGVEGAVDLSFVVSACGEVQDVTVVHAEPSSVFNHAAVAAVRRWKYQPRMVNGIPVEGRVQLRMTFKLDGQG
jgi:protein TonB